MTPPLQASHAPVCAPQQEDVRRAVSPREGVYTCWGYRTTDNIVTNSVISGARGSVNRYSSLCSTGEKFFFCRLIFWHFKSYLLEYWWVKWERKETVLPKYPRVCAFQDRGDNCRPGWKTTFKGNNEKVILVKWRWFSTYNPSTTQMCQYGFVTVNTTTEKGRESAIMAWVEGIPYSWLNLGSIRTTSGIGGLGQRSRSFRAWTFIIQIKVRFMNILKYVLTWPI